MKCPVYYCLSTRTDEITSLHQIYHCHGSVVLRNSSTVDISDCVFSLTIPVRCCSTVLNRRVVTDLVSYRLNIISRPDIHLGRLLLVSKLAILRGTDTHRGAVKSSTYRSATTKCTGKVIRQTNNVKLPTVLLFVGAMLQIGRLLVRSQLVSEFFIDIKPFRSHYGPGVDSASNRNEYQEHFRGVKTAGA